MMVNRKRNVISADDTANNLHYILVIARPLIRAEFPNL